MFGSWGHSVDNYNYRQMIHSIRHIRFNHIQELAILRNHIESIDQLS